MDSDWGAPICEGESDDEGKAEGEDSSGGKRRLVSSAGGSSSQCASVMRSSEAVKRPPNEAPKEWSILSARSNCVDIRLFK